MGFPPKRLWVVYSELSTGIRAIDYFRSGVFFRREFCTDEIKFVNADRRQSRGTLILYLVENIHNRRSPGQLDQ
jgi:hypothetical protein